MRLKARALLSAVGCCDAECAYGNGEPARGNVTPNCIEDRKAPQMLWLLEPCGRLHILRGERRESSHSCCERPISNLSSDVVPQVPSLYKARAAQH
eukprot:scaffold40841_cov20-Tisochrysis_lutea.AAC.2